MPAIRESSQGASFAVRVHPRAPRTKITGVLGQGEDAALKVALCAPPIDGRANEALVEYFSDLFSVSRAAVQIIGGTQSRNKVVRIDGRTAADVASMLSSLLT